MGTIDEAMDRVDAAESRVVAAQDAAGHVRSRVMELAAEMEFPAGGHISYPSGADNPVYNSPMLTGVPAACLTQRNPFFGQVIPWDGPLPEVV